MYIIVQPNFVWWRCLCKIQTQREGFSHVTEKIPCFTSYLVSFNILFTFSSAILLTASISVLKEVNIVNNESLVVYSFHRRSDMFIRIFFTLILSILEKSQDFLFSSLGLLRNSFVSVCLFYLRCQSFVWINVQRFSVLRTIFL